MNGARNGGGVGEALLTAAAAGLLAVGAVAASGETKHDAGTARDRDGTNRARDASGRVALPAGESEELALALAEPGVKGRVERLQARHAPIAFVVGVVKKFGEDRGSRLAALVAYYGFFSLFPALLALVTILGFVLEGNDSMRNSIRDSALAQFPVIGDSIGAAADKPLTGNTLALVIGLLGALWAGMGAMQAGQDAANAAWNVPRDEEPSFFVKRGRSLGGLLLMAVLFVATAFVPRAAEAFSSGFIGWALALLLTAALDIAVIFAAFWLFTAVKVHWRDHLPGAVVAGVAYLILQSLGTLYVTHTLNGAQKTYGTFAGVIGLLSWMYLLAQVSMFATEINVVRARRLWPRSLFTPEQLEKNRRAREAGAA